MSSCLKLAKGARCKVRGPIQRTSPKSKSGAHLTKSNLCVLSVCLSSAPCVLSCPVCPRLSVVSVLSFPGLSCPACHACPLLFCLALSCLLCLSCPVLVLSCLACPVFSLSCLVRRTLSAFCPLFCLCSPVLSWWPLYRHKKLKKCARHPWPK